MTSSKQDFQEREYSAAYHWQCRNRVERIRYDRETATFSTLIQKYSANQHGAMQIWDIGCGDGCNTLGILKDLQQSGREVSILGFDISEKAIEWAKAHSQENNGAKFFDSNFNEHENLRRDDAHRVVILREVIEHIAPDELRLFFESIRQVIQPHFITLSVPTWNSPVPQKHFRHFNASQLEECLNQLGWSLVAIQGFGYRPKPLYSLLHRAKRTLGPRRLLWRLMTWPWRTVATDNAITIFAVFQPK